MAHVSACKKAEVKTLKTLIDSHHVVGLVDIEGIKAKQLQRIRQDMRGKVLIRASKNTLLAIALKKSKKKKLEELAAHLKGGASLICCDLDPFRLNMLLEKSRTPALARPGDTAPEDIVIAAGDTGFPPGPLVGDLQRAGIPARIEKGTIMVQKDHTFVKAQEPIGEGQADILRKLGIEPMTVGLQLLGVCEDEKLFEPSVLCVDVEGVRARLQVAHQYAVTLGVEACIITDETFTLLIQKAVRYAHSLAVEAVIVTKETLPTILAKAQATAHVVNSLIKGEPVVPAAPPPQEIKDKKEDKKEEEALDGLGALFG
jgi:large subunit ribosomal protein L10